MHKTQSWRVPALILALGATPALSQNFMLESDVGFPDFGFMESPKSYQGPVFVLADDFPATLPDLDPEVVEILAIDFEVDPLAYVLAVRDYVFKGNIHGGNVADDFILQNNSEGISWYHMPWQHWGTTGREGYHGLTREGPLSAQVLAPEQTESSYAYAVGFYNGPGGFTIGQVWPDANGGPDLAHMIAAMETGFAFPEGTVVGKFLFTALDDTQVPWLANPLQWNSYMYQCDADASVDCPKDMTTAPRVTQAMNLLQMDVMVKDSRAAEAGGWVFGTFTYNGAAASSPEFGSRYSAACAGISGGGENWCNLMPVGVMWGNDPDNAETFINKTPTETVINADLDETWINPDKALPAMHLGFNSRLNGPADNPTSSCMSCHATGQVPSVSAIMPWLPPNNIAIPQNGDMASDEWMRWFRNFEDGEAFDAGQAVSMDFSMQMTKGIENYIEYRAQTEAGLFALQYWNNAGAGPISRGAEIPSQ
ncbi:MAG: cytochrome P460 family protein [Octadecabacter sp.]|nr:cytochrome P460 family protein [Octadecabacter sp.]